ncbi:MAG: indolepyruvate oxidoreductase subunit beta [Candidatus Bipolaricaulia bacterium]
MSLIETVDIALAGVGGQGSVLAGRIVARAAEIDGRKVATSEVHGMSQRGGSVFSTVRYGPEEVLSPMIPQGEADVLLAFERLESLRYLTYVAQGGIVVVNDQRLAPPLESLKAAAYPDNVAGILRYHTDRVWMVPGLDRADRLGNPKLANTVTLGALSAQLDLGLPSWRQALCELVPPQTVDLNLAAFEAGIAWAEAEHSARAA